MTRASLVPNRLLHIVPQALFIHISARPIVTFGPPTNLTSHSVQFPNEVDISAGYNFIIKRFACISQ